MKTFCLILGAAGAIVILALSLRARRQPALPLYVPLLSILCVAGFLFAVAYSATSWAEGEKQAALRSLLIFGLPWLILACILWALAVRRPADRTAGRTTDPSHPPPSAASSEQHDDR